MTDRRKALAFLGLAGIGVCVEGPRAADTETAESTANLPVAREVSRAERMKRHFPNVSLLTHDGRSVRFYDDLVKGKETEIMEV